MSWEDGRFVSPVAAGVVSGRVVLSTLCLVGTYSY